MPFICAKNKHKEMYRFLFAFIILAVIFSSCDDQNELKMGQEYMDNNSEIILIDDLELELSTVQLDSVATSDATGKLVGKFQHPLIGEINSESVCRLDPQLSYDIEDEDIFDSITISMYYDGYYLGDTAEVYNFSVYELETNIEDLDQSSYYNSTIVETSTEPLGSFSIFPRPAKTDKLEFRLPDAFGSNWFNMIMEEADEMKENSKFYEYFNGLVFKGDENNKALLGFMAEEDSVCINLYYHRVGERREELQIKFGSEGDIYDFNICHHNKENTLLASLQTQDEELKASETGNVSFIQGSTGLATKVNFPGLAEVFQLVELDQIIKAELILVPTKESEDINDLPEYLIAYESDRINSLNDVVEDGSGNTTALSLNPADDNFESQEYYSIDITDYIVECLVTGYFDKDNALLITQESDELINTVSTVMLGAEDNEDYKPKLVLYTYYY